MKHEIESFVTYLNTKKCLYPLSPRRKDTSKSIYGSDCQVCGRVGHRPRTNPLKFG